MASHSARGKESGTLSGRTSGLQDRIIDSAPCWCGQWQWQVQFRTKRLGLVRCGACGCYRIDPRPLQQEESAADYYSAYYAEMEQQNGGEPLERRQSRFWRVVDQVPELAQPGGRAADIGCGNGRLCAELSRAGWHDVTGIEVARSRLFAARRSYPHLNFHGSVEEARVAPATLELLVLDNVVEHLLEPRVDLLKWRDLLRVDGRVVIITPNMVSGHFRLLGRRWTPELAPHHHIFLFTPGALRGLVERAGMRVETSGTFHVPAFSLAAWLHLVGRLQLKEVVWRGGQELGAFYGRLLGAGPMLYVVARRAEPPGPDTTAW